jgi:microcystin-dependent protein
MPLETATYIDDLVATNPASGDGLSQTDDHLRLIKAAIKATFPNIDGAVNATPAQLNQLVSGLLGLGDGTSGSPAIFFNSDTDLGFYRVAANKVGVAGRMVGNGAVACGSIHTFPKVPTSFGTSASDLTKEYLECNGAVYNMADYPDLGAFLGSTFGGNGTTTFGVPNYYTDGRFLRSRTASLAVGTEQADSIESHTHTASSASNGAHTHTATDSGHTHTVVAPTSRDKIFVTTDGVPSGDVWGDNNGGASSSEASGSGTANITVASGGAHTHDITVNATGDTETRPVAAAVIFAIKT